MEMSYLGVFKKSEKNLSTASRSATKSRDAKNIDVKFCVVQLPKLTMPQEHTFVWRHVIKTYLVGSINVPVSVTQEIVSHVQCTQTCHCHAHVEPQLSNLQ